MLRVPARLASRLRRAIRAVAAIFVFLAWASLAPAQGVAGVPSATGDATQTTTASPATVPSDGLEMPENAISTFLADAGEALNRGATVALTGIEEFPEALGNSLALLQSEGQATLHLGIATPSALLGGLLGAALFRIVFHVALQHFSTRPHLPRSGFALLRLTGDLLSVLIFFIVSRSGLMMAMDAGSFARVVAFGMAHVLVSTGLYGAFGRLLFSDCGKKGPLLQVESPRWHLIMMTMFGFLVGFTGTTIRIADVHGLGKIATDGWLFLSSTMLTLYKLVWFISSRHDIARAFADADAGRLRKTVAAFIADFYSFSALFIWLLGLMVVGTTQDAIWSRASGFSQLLFIVTPIIDRGCFASLRALAQKRGEANGPALATAFYWTLPIPVSGAIWLLCLHGTTLLWEPLLVQAGMDPAMWLGHVRNFAVVLIACWTLCSLLWKYFELITPAQNVLLPGQDDGHGNKTASRLGTALPLMRNLILGLVAAVALLAILQTAGVNIAPLLAGFGVLGLALSFGSQTLVKDVVSGIFFLAEDAFRIGEYIDTGKLKGTVEQISLRSVRLRHHNGPIHTVPYGQISAVTNFSRDWGTVKFELRFDRDADLETIRKTAKKVGLAMLEEPEYGHEFLIPLKMQGIQEVNETSMVVRFKFTSRPGNPSLIKRDGIKRLLAAFKAAGLNLASNAVVVRGSSDTLSEGAAASQSTVQAANIA